MAKCLNSSHSGEIPFIMDTVRVPEGFKLDKTN